MKPNWRFAVLMLTALYLEQAGAQGIQITNLDGGTVFTELLKDKFKVNDKSSLHRTWTVVNDSSCPIQLSVAGIGTVFQVAPGPFSYSGDYFFESAVSAETSKAGQAFEIRFLLYDAFGEHFRTLSKVDFEDLPAKTTRQFRESRWRASYADVQRLLIVVAFVAQVRGEDGKIWRCNQKAISDELGLKQFKVTGVFDLKADTVKSVTEK